jgi:spore coat polysaccharide biosynthesis protein SpsF (cytidylyltransferase family)
MQMVGNKTMLRRVWDAAHFMWFAYTFKIIVAWPERYPDLDENNVLERFRRISKEFPSKYIIRLTADCPLLTTHDIKWELAGYHGQPYISNHKDGHDVQIFTRTYLFNGNTSVEHVIADFTTKPTGLSVNTKEDLERVRKLCV